MIKVGFWLGKLPGRLAEKKNDQHLSFTTKRSWKTGPRPRKENWLRGEGRGEEEHGGGGDVSDEEDERPWAGGSQVLKPMIPVPVKCGTWVKDNLCSGIILRRPGYPPEGTDATVKHPTTLGEVHGLDGILNG